MDTKLTLSLDKQIIDAAKQYAKKRNTSLSNLIENYLMSIVKPSKTSEVEISPLVKSLSGVLKIDKKTEHKKHYADYLRKKYK
jgi:hypothetical protein